MRDFRCYLHVASLSLTPLQFYCHVLVYCFGSFLLQDMFLSLQVFAFEGRNMTFTVNVLLTCILNCDTTGYDLELSVSTVDRSVLVTGIMFALVRF